MHQLVILTALTATSGLFGGHGRGPKSHCGRPQMSRHAASVYAPAPCAPTQMASGCSQGYGYPAPVAAPAHAPAPAPYMAPPQAAPQAMAPQAMSYPSYYSAPSAMAPSCPGGNCARR